MFRVLAEHAFLFTMFLVVFAGLLSGIVLFLALSQAKEVDSSDSLAVTFRQDAFEEIIKEWAKRDVLLRGTGLPLSRDIFSSQ